MQADDEYVNESSTDSSLTSPAQAVRQIQERPGQEQPDARYASGKPRRIIIRARVTHGER
jgi:hypothetical protein